MTRALRTALVAAVLLGVPYYAGVGAAAVYLVRAAGR